MTSSTRPPGLLARIVGALLTLAALAIGLLFSVVVLIVAVLAGGAFFGWLWWKARSLRKLAEQAAASGNGFDPVGAAPRRSGDVIEGEVISAEWKDSSR